MAMMKHAFELKTVVVKSTLEARKDKEKVRFLRVMLIKMYTFLLFH